MPEKIDLNLNIANDCAIKNTVKTVTQVIDNENIIGNKFFTESDVGETNPLGLDLKLNKTENENRKYPFLLFDSQGMLDASQFSLQTFQERYGKDYIVNDDNGKITIAGPECNPQIKMTITKESDNCLKITYNDRNESLKLFIPKQPEFKEVPSFSNSLNLIENDKKTYAQIVEHSYFDKKEQKQITVSLCGINILDKLVSDKDGNVISYTEYYDEKRNELVKDGQFLFIKDIQKILKRKSCAINQPFLDLARARCQNYLAQIEKKNKERQSSDLFKATYPVGHTLPIDEFLIQYEKMTGADYISDVVDCFGDDISMELDMLTDGRTRLVEQNKNTDRYDNYILNLFKKHLKINNDSCKICCLAGIYINSTQCNPFKNFPDLISAINNSQIPADEKKDLLNMIIKYSPNDDKTIEAVLNSDLKYLIENNNELTQRVKSVKTKEEKRDLYIDIKRILKQNSNIREYLANGNKLPEKQPLPSNGKIDLNFKQGAKGDCWLLAGLMALKDKPNGQAILDSLLSFNKKTGSVTVNLKGVNKTYEISKEEIENSNWFSTGDGDIRAIEIAVDKYIGEQAKQGNTEDIDSNNNFVVTAWDILLGDNKSEIFVPEINKKSQKLIYDKSVAKYEKNFDFNNPNELYAFNFPACTYLENGGTLSDFQCCDTKTNNNIRVITNHAYSVISSDDKYIYFRNPHDSSKILKVEKDFLEKYNAQIHTAFFK